jgi:membrane associated rhomboid family serine protease
MSDAALPPLEMILRQCADKAPEPWYPSLYARETGTPRDSLDPHLDRLRLGGFVQLTEWESGKGQGYRLTPEGKELLLRQRLLDGVRNGQLPERRAEPQRPDSAREMVLPSEAVRDSVFGGESYPVMTRGLIYANIAVFLAGLFLAVRGGASVGEYMAGASQGEAGAVIRDAQLQTGAIEGQRVYFKHEWWRLLTCCFVHFGLVHIGVNMVALWSLGPITERILGPWRFLLFYLLCGIVGSCGVLLENPLGLAAGASGAIWGLMSGLAVLIFVHRSALPPQVAGSILRQLGFWIILNVLITLNIPMLSKGAHFGGGIAGAILAVPVDYLRYGRGMQRWLAVVVILLVPTLAFGMAYRSLERMAALRGQPESAEDHARTQKSYDQFNQDYMGDIGKAIIACERQSASVRALLEMEPKNRDADVVQGTIKQIAGQREDVEDLVGKLTRQGRYPDRRLESARAFAIDYLRAYDKLLEAGSDCLRLNVAQAEAEKQLAPLESDVKEARQKWTDLLK